MANDAEASSSMKDQLSRMGRLRMMEMQTKQYMSQYEAAENGNWTALRAILHRGFGGFRANTKISMFSENIIHDIVSQSIDTSFLRELITDDNFDESTLLEKDSGGNTALHIAAVVGNTEAAKIMIEKSRAVLFIKDSDGTFPVHVAALLGHEETTRYLIDEMLKIHYHGGLNEMDGVQLLNFLITAGFYDIARQLLARFPNLAHEKDIDGISPLQTFASRPLRGNRNGAIFLIELICQNVHSYVMNLEGTETLPSDVLWHPLLTATKLGIYEVVEAIIRKCPYIAWFTEDEHGRTIYHYAVQYRHVKIFNLIWNGGSDKYQIAKLVSNIDNSNILHLAASMELSVTTSTNQVSGAALQMQRELQWFEEVKKLAQVSFQDEKLKKKDDKRTPGMLFTDEHRILAKDGENWMKTIASAYTLVTALIITVLFAAAFAVPGGNDSKGIPNFLHKPYFIVFSIANSIGFFSSSTSLMMFLGILTSRYSEIDFLHSLPRKLVIGLSTLFLSILCMLIAFSAALYSYLQHLSKYVMIPILVCPCIPAILFLFLQFPLLFEVAYATYGPSIFHQERKSLKTKPAYVRGQAFVRTLSSSSTSVLATLVNSVAAPHNSEESIIAETPPPTRTSTLLSLPTPPIPEHSNV